MFEALTHHPEIGRVTVWVHGAEIQPWWRRPFNYQTDEEIDQAKEVTRKRLQFWKQVFHKPPKNFHFVFVSKFFAESVFEDLGMELPDDRYSIIPNPIDTSIFQYAETSPSHAHRVLSIRPYASPTYANDLSVQAVLDLAERPGFDELSFRFVGDGPLFEETLEPLRGLENVEIQRGFLTHREIAEMHRDFGLFLTPSRTDTHGVSRDEAMSSGLVPITNSVAAIPEFVDETCGFLAPAEDHQGLADAIWACHQDPSMFLAKSRSAAQRVRRQAAASVTIPRELQLFS